MIECCATCQSSSVEKKPNSTLPLLSFLILLGNYSSLCVPQRITGVKLMRNFLLDFITLGYLLLLLPSGVTRTNHLSPSHPFPFPPPTTLPSEIFLCSSCLTTSSTSFVRYMKSLSSAHVRTIHASLTLPQNCSTLAV